ncbi:hypothetical protein [Sutterella sp.]|uniref:hypothetical protein n=1 Tax=Sutterella sp. TaxID=1981025 RepID=UPI0026DF332E|nr:hypothetical protein [Sutterella sp.]MDO5532006.1 hypothetical protein [Sutterella sp.]
MDILRGNRNKSEFEQIIEKHGRDETVNCFARLVMLMLVDYDDVAKYLWQEVRAAECAGGYPTEFAARIRRTPEYRFFVTEDHYEIDDFDGVDLMNHICMEPGNIDYLRRTNGRLRCDIVEKILRSCFIIEQSKMMNGGRILLDPLEYGEKQQALEMTGTVVQDHPRLGRLVQAAAVYNCKRHGQL